MQRWLAPWREFGAAAGTVYLLERLLQRLSPACSAQLHELVEQPVPGAALLPPAHAQHLRYVVLQRDSPELAAMPRPAAIVAARFDQGAVGLAVYLRDKYVGYVWLAFDHYDEDQLRCRFQLSRPDRSAFDFDVYVFPAFRLGRAFAAVWHAANGYLGERGMVRTCSRIDSANLSSRRAHAQLGARRLTRALFLRAGRWQLVVCSALPWPKVHAGWSATPVIRL